MKELHALRLRLERRSKLKVGRAAAQGDDTGFVFMPENHSIAALPNVPE